VAGLVGLAALVGATPLAMSTRMPLVVQFAVIGGFAAAALLGGLRYSRRAPSPYLGRFAEIADVLAIMALVPLACVVAGLYAAIQGQFASF
jgi:hypothetical protein